MAKAERLCIPPFLSDNKMLCKSAEGKGGYCNNIPSMANSSILSNLMLLVLSIDNPILLPSLQYLLLCTQILMSDTPTNANQYSEITFMESFRRIKVEQEFLNQHPNFWQQDGRKELTQLTTASADSGVQCSWCHSSKLIHFTPLWKIQLIF